MDVESDIDGSDRHIGDEKDDRITAGSDDPVQDSKHQQHRSPGVEQDFEKIMEPSGVPFDEDVILSEMVQPRCRLFAGQSDPWPGPIKFVFQKGW